MGTNRKFDILIDIVVSKIIKEEYVSTPFIQRHFKISYLKAQHILRKLEEMRYIDKVEEFKQIKVLKNNYIQ